MEWLKLAISARWFPYAAIGLVAFVGTVFGFGYTKGYGSAELNYQEAMNKALQSQYETLVTQSQRERELALDVQRREYEIGRNVADVPAPADSCTLTPDCLRWFDNILRATTHDPD